MMRYRNLHALLSCPFLQWHLELPTDPAFETQ